MALMMMRVLLTLTTSDRCRNTICVVIEITPIELAIVRIRVRRLPAPVIRFVSAAMMVSIAVVVRRWRLLVMMARLDR